MTILPASGPRTAPARRVHGFALVDVDTTGLNTYSDRVVQVAVRQLDLNGVLERGWQSLVDPERDPGPTRIHGITSKMLVGAPTFGDIASTVAELIQGRVLVAHYAIFDWRFLHAESNRVGQELSSPSQICTIKLAKMLDLKVPNYKLSSLAKWAKANKNRTHTADDDVRVLQDVFLKLVRQAKLAGIPLRPSPNKAPPPERVELTMTHGVNSLWHDPGPWIRTAPLVQGMTLTMSGGTPTFRATLYRQALAAGLVPLHTIGDGPHFLVCTDPTMSTGKAQGARDQGIPIISPEVFLDLLACVQEGRRSPHACDPVGVCTTRKNCKVHQKL